MDITNLIIFLGVGALAGIIMKGRGFGLVGNIIIGIVGAIVLLYIISILKKA